MAGCIAAIAVFLAAGGSADPVAAKEVVEPVVATSVPCCLEIVSVSPTGYASGPSVARLFSSAAPAPSAAASRWRVIDVRRLLPVGMAPEQGLQVKTILLSRSISVVFPEIHSIGGVRPDALRWHPEGLALDVMIPNPSSDAGIKLENQSGAYALKNAKRFSLQDAIWRGVYYTPNGPQNTGAAHFDHVHLTTFGGGYPSGGEQYYR